MSKPDRSGDPLGEQLAQALRGDEAACATLFYAYSPAILRLSLGLLNDLADAEEVTQDTFIYALRNLGRFDALRSAFRTWLFTIAISRCRNKRRRKWLPQLPLEWLANEPSARPERVVEAALERRGVRRQVWTALQKLPPRLREAVVLRYLGGLHYKEVGQAVGCHPKTAESRVRLGLEAMRASLRQHAGEIESALAEWTAN